MLLRSGKMIKTGNESDLPNEILLEVLLRVPVKDVLRCRCVCIQWKNLTSTQYFMDLHSRRNLPVILAEDPPSKKRPLNTCLLDKWWEPTPTRSVIHKFKICPRIYFSQAGFVVSQFQSGIFGQFIVQNPLFREEVRIVIPTRRYVQMYGIFFHPVLNEYCILLGMSLPPLLRPVQYKLLNLSSEPCLRGLNSPHRLKDVYSCSVFINDNYLYWMVRSEERGEEKGNSHCEIMEFDTRNEEFRLLPNPIPETIRGSCFNVNLMSVYGLLSIVSISLVEELFVINKWTLKDRVEQEQVWTNSKYTVKDEGYFGRHSIQALALVDNELVVRSVDKLLVTKLLVCNQVSGISRNFGKKDYHQSAQFLSHEMTLASLKNCKTKIYLEDCEREEMKTKNCLASYYGDKEKELLQLK